MKPQTGLVTASQFDAEPIQEGRRKYKYPQGRELSLSRPMEMTWQTPEKTSREAKP